MSTRDRVGEVRRELDELQAQIAALETRLENGANHSLGAGAAMMTDWELDRSLLRRLRERATDIEQMLAQAGEIAYGICAQCGNPIHPDRLAVLPGTRECIRCARAGEREKRERGL